MAVFSESWEEILVWHHRRITIEYMFFFADCKQNMKVLLEEHGNWN